MSTTEGERQATRAAELVDEYGGLRPFVQQFGVGGIIFAFVVNIIDAINATGELLLAPFRALATGLSVLIEDTFGVSLDIIAAGGATAVRSIETGLAAILGPFAFPFAVLVVMIAIWIFIRAAQNIEFSPLVFIRSRIGR